VALLLLSPHLLSPLEAQSACRRERQILARISYFTV
jgi:hypothetical protein